MEAGWSAVNVARLYRQAGCDPATKAAVEKVNISGSEALEHPPCSRSGEDPFLFIDNDVHLIADPQRRSAPGKLLGPRQHVGQRAGVVGELLNIKEDCARNMLREVARSGIHCRRDTDRRERGIKDNDARIVQTAG